MKEFELVAKYKLAGDQPSALAGLYDGIGQGLAYQTLLGVTGSGKTFTITNLIKKLERHSILNSQNERI